jgi:hypothetical protein
MLYGLRVLSEMARVEWTEILVLLRGDVPRGM